ncbi:hypothetical protein BKA64DRAFT_749957 [Cadophora sp. MPI-SDFR-AT-0126]|nr:hypothetical protein BKA64DRAFT_749957 [Leotiomycetes sp. MPI-SDFR-AT-0126]
MKPFNLLTALPLSLSPLTLILAQTIELNLPTAISASILSDELNPTATVIVYYASDTTLTSTLQASPTGTDSSSLLPLITDTLASPSMSSTATLRLSTLVPSSSETDSSVSSMDVSSATVSLMSPTGASSTTVSLASSSTSAGTTSTSTTATTSTSSAGAAATGFGVGLGGLLGAAAGVMAIL